MASLGRIGKYELLRSLAVGGMAEIYLARQTGMQQFEKVVVIKKILPHLGTQDRFVQMFLDEARLAARLNHHNIVQIYDLGQEGDAFYIAMEYVQGEDIKTLVRQCAKLKRRIPIEHVVKVFSGVLDGLHYAHSQKLLDGSATGIVHRDVSPHNILVSYQGAIKLVDFGIAKARSQISTTIPGRVKGKHAYMSPEQCQGHDLDGRSDVFSVGIVMYELLTWTRLFKRKHDIDTLKAVTSGEIRPLRALRPQVDPELEQIVLRALSRKQEERFQTAQEMQEALEDYLLAKGLKSNPVELSRFMEDLFTHKLAAMNKALEEAQVENLDAAVARVGPDLVDFLDMFFADKGSGTDPETASKSGSGDFLDAPEFTPSGEYTPAKVPHPSTREVPRRRNPAVMAAGPTPPPVKAPPPRAPKGMGVRHVAPSREPVQLRAPPQADQVDAAPVSQPRDIIDPQTVDFPPPSDPMAGERLPGEPDPYADELMPTGKRSGKGFLVLAFLILAGLAGLLIYSFKDTEQASTAPATGRIKVTSVPSGADVHFNDRRLPSLTPTEVGDVEPNVEHTLRVALPRYPDWEQKITLTDTTKPLEVKAVLSKDAAQKALVSGKPIIAGIPGQGTGTIVVKSQPPRALVYLDGISTRKKTPATLRGVSAGLDHVVMLEHQGKTPAFERLTLQSGAEATVNLALEDGNPALPGRYVVQVETEPEGATVVVNDYPLKKKTPVPVSLMAREASDISIELKGYRTWTFVARPIPGLKLTYYKKLQKK